MLFLLGKGITPESLALSVGSVLGPPSCVDHRWRMKKITELMSIRQGLRFLGPLLMIGLTIYNLPSVERALKDEIGVNFYFMILV